MTSLSQSCVDAGMILLTKFPGACLLPDPHAKFLPGVNAAQPGLKIAFQRANLLAQFPDAFRPYLHFGCTLQQRYSGTLFRFPLRSQQAAAVSEIKGSECTVDSVLQLFEGFRAQLPQALLFLKSVRKVEVYVKHSGSEVPMALQLMLPSSSPAPGLAAPEEQEAQQVPVRSIGTEPGSTQLLFRAGMADSQGKGDRSLQSAVVQYITGEITGMQGHTVAVEQHWLFLSALHVLQ